MRLRDLAAFLFAGDRDAIERLAQSRTALYVGALLVLTASIARNHDGIWIAAEWITLTHGIVISTINAVLLFMLFDMVAYCRGKGSPDLGRSLLAFLGLFWLTSPMAWLYAIPYEHMMPPEMAIQFNALTLALVSVWRVMLIARVMSVLWNESMVITTPLVLFYSNILVVIGSFTMPVPIIDFMGGLQHNDPAEETLLWINLMVRIMSCLALVITATLALVAAFCFKGSFTLALPSPMPTPKVSRGIIAMLLCAAVVMGLLLATFQPAQARRYEASRLLREDFGAGLAFMSRYERKDFPPIWDPAPRRGYWETTPGIEAMRRGLATTKGVPWAREVFLERSWENWTRESRVQGWRFDSDPARHLKDLTSGYLNTVRFSPNELASLLGGLRFHVEHDERFKEAHRDEIRTWLEIIEQQTLGAESRDGHTLAKEAPTDQTSDPLPRHRLHRRLAREGRLRSDRGWESYTLFDVVHTPDRMSADELQAGFYNVVRMAFAEAPVARRMQRRREIWSRRGVVA